MHTDFHRKSLKKKHAKQNQNKIDTQSLFIHRLHNLSLNSKVFNRIGVDKYGQKMSEQCFIAHA